MLCRVAATFAYRYSIAAIRWTNFAFPYIRRRSSCRLIGGFVISPLPHLVERNTHRSGPFPPGAFCCTPINSSTTRSATLAPAPAFPTRGYSSRLLDEISSPGTEGFSSFQHHPSHHVAADTPPVRAAVSDSFRPALSAFARYRPSQPPEIRIARLRLRSLVRCSLVRCAHSFPSLLSEGSVVLLAHHDVYPTRGLSLLAWSR